ncbi:glycerophosphoryl diester phosphodiesterase [Flavobacterium glycines]|uniref:Glycerophosphodiester phosphodiesterase n=1 Tax=Flavobacterium glycines TaxID=551990 RepID=A0A1B9DMT1_9FLAO|nr:glycerophosphodiester phosphodiesterase family protein [Flavobacterium glycines]OCB71020.1 glycerophosphodiester phosphodiesterase [Flavobacterium glycines]GEL10833.1 glycerophosphoryl diester phosphodiesterase [Flavobacterium glycines]SDI52268.1 glycerophosphoryl diester phosphodiesterase [Flavobacterium glycines]
MLKIGHRGARGYAAENTLSSFEKAIDLKVDGIELDVHLSADGELMVIHDETIDRTTNGKGLVNSFTKAELQNFSIEDNNKIPTLSSVFDLVDRRCFINIELKSFETAAKVVALIEKYIREKHWKYTDFIVSSFDWDALEEVNFVNPEIPIAVLTETDLDKALAFAKIIQAKAINPDFQLLNIENTKKLQENGFEVYPWTVNETADIKKMQSFNVNGIISDFPDKISFSNH